MKSVFFKWKRWGTSIVTSLILRRFGFFSPPILVVAMATSTLILLAPSVHVTVDDRSITLRTLLQIASTILGMNIVGLTINANQFGQATSIRSLLSRLAELAEPLYENLYNSHPRRQKLQRPSFVRFIIQSTSITDLLFKNDDKEQDYFVYRPGWDGVWYQLVYSPFANHRPASERQTVVALHEATLITMRLFQQVIEMRASGCCLLSTVRGSNGTRWFLEALEKIRARDEFLGSVGTPTKLSPEEAASYINLCLDSGHYLQEELREQLEESNWEPAKVTLFACFFIRQTIWMGFLWRKLQSLRFSLISVRSRKSWDEISDTAKRHSGMVLVNEAQPQLLKLGQMAAAEFGVANRFWIVRQAAIPGIGWAMAFLSITAVMWPITASMGHVVAVASVFALVYGIGIVALLESLIFAYTLIWGRRSASPFKPYGSRPPRP